MKKHFYPLPLAALLLAHPAHAQHTEVVERAGANLSWYGGPDAAPTSFINRHSQDGLYFGDAYTNTPYGTRAGLGLGLGLRVLRVGERGQLWAYDLGYDWQRVGTDITSVSNVDWSARTQQGSYQRYAADGRTYLHSHNISLFVGYGHRFQAGTLHLDALAGPELAAVLASREHGQGTFNNGYRWTTDAQRSSAGVDGRLRADLIAWHGRTGLNASYSLGLISAQASLVGGPARQSFGQTVRFGIAYLLNN
ncbi:hypothetical protein GCM10028824_35730 [Hymenobacter segetis]|uniref:Outer membrane protein beta-barrel domain-containing protein n=1 Tax=Hymenobacter segetis TaxID=2025509 RepID=A0ABU9LWL7_9BACT